MAEDVYRDKRGEYPKREYNNAPTTNLEARGIEENHLAIGGGDVEFNLGLKPLPSSQYPMNQVRRSVTGHVTEIDDTPGRERMLFKHKTGAGIDMRPDGTVIVNTTNNQITIAGGDQSVIIEGNGKMTYHGNLSMRVDGNFDLDVGGNMNVTVGKYYEEDIQQGYRSDVNGPHNTYINGVTSKIITKSESNMILGDQNNQIKGDVDTNIQGAEDHGVKGQQHVTSETRIINTSPDINIGASHLNVLGDSGTVGGENIIMYNYNHYTNHSMYVGDPASSNLAGGGDLSRGTLYSHTIRGYVEELAESLTTPVTVGNLQGTASVANVAGVAPNGTGATGVIPSAGSLLSEDGTATGEPNNTNMKQTWFTGEYGIFTVAIDIGNAIYNKLNRIFDYNNITEKTLTTRDVRSKLRDPANQQNVKFVGQCIAEGILSPTYTVSIPKKIGSIISNDPTPRNPNPNEVFGVQPGAEQKRYSATVQKQPYTLRASDDYNPELKTRIDRYTKLAPGITVAKFLGGYGEEHDFDDLILEDRIRIAKHWYLQTPLMKSVMNDVGEFHEFRLVVERGYYKAETQETITEFGLNDLARKGRVVVYELYDREGKQAQRATFRLAAWWKDSQRFEKLILNYDSYNPSNKMNVQLIVVMPELSDVDALGEFTATYAGNIETRLNNYVQSTNEFTEILKI